MPSRILGLSLLAAAAAALGFAATVRAAPERRLTLFYTAEVHGTPEPCGCTSDPLGDVARYAALVRAAARKGPVLLRGLDKVLKGATARDRSGTAQRKRVN